MHLPMRFTGQRLDGTGLYYYGARYYDANIGRFISADSMVQSIANPQSLNRYSYCLNNPLKYTDPTGHWSWGDLFDAFVDYVVAPIVDYVVEPFIDYVVDPVVDTAQPVAENVANVITDIAAQVGDWMYTGYQTVTSAISQSVAGAAGITRGSSSIGTTGTTGTTQGGSNYGESSPSLPADKGSGEIGGPPSPSLPDPFQGLAPESAKPDIVALAIETLETFAPFAVGVLTSGFVTCVGAAMVAIGVGTSPVGAGIVIAAVGVGVAGGGITGMLAISYSAYQLWNAQDFGGRWGQALGIGQ